MKKALTPALAAALGLLLALAGPAAAANPCAQMKAWLKAGGGSQSGLMVMDAETEEVVCAAGAETMLPLASNTKLFTTSTALSKFGPSSTIATKLLTDGTIDPNGVLHGSLYLQGGGDPALGTPTFYNSYLAGLGTNIFALVPQLKRAGIKAVTGRLYGDDTIFDRKRGVADSGYATSVYIGPLSGLDFNSGFAGNTSSSHFSSDPAKLATQTSSTTACATRGSRSARRSPSARPPPTRNRSPSSTPHRSREIVNTTDVYSDNFFAEMLEKLLGARFGGAGTTAAGTHVVEAYAAGPRLRHPPGRWLRPHPHEPRLARRRGEAAGRRAGSAIGEEFIQDLALSGKEGTTAGRMKGTAAYGRCRLKTGTLTGVSNLSGYCFNTDGRVMVFSTLMGSVGSTETAHAYQDKIAGAVACY